MSERFSKLIKLPKDPAAKIVAQGNILLRTPVTYPASASVEVLLTKLAAKDAWVDIMTVLAHALPAREAVWWACLAARDLTGPGDQKAPPCLRAAENWVLDPSDANRAVARAALDGVYVDDDTNLVATAAMYAAGNMGPGDMANYPAPVGIVGGCVFGMNMLALAEAEDFDRSIQILIDRALDIGRGGNGHVADLVLEKGAV